MKTNARETIGLLHQLIKICRDSHGELNTAARQISDPHVHALFQALAADRLRYLRELQDCVRALGGPPASGPAGEESLPADSTETVEDDMHDLLAERERGEDAIRTAYENAVQDGSLDAATQRMVENQYAEIHAAHDRVKTLVNHPVSMRR